MDTAIRAAYELCGFANQQELNEWDLERRREKARFDMGSRLSSARREAQEKKALEIARKMKTAGRPCSEIEEFTSLPSEVIAKL